MSKWHGINENTGLTYCGKDSSGDQCCYVTGEHAYWHIISKSSPNECCKKCTSKINKEPNSAVQSFYTALKAKMTGQVINGVLKGCILEHELEEAYEEFRKQ